MKILSACSVLSCVLLSATTAFAAQPSPPHASNTNIPKAHLSTPVKTRAAAPIVKTSAASKPAVAASQTQQATPAPAQAAAPAPKPSGVFRRLSQGADRGRAALQGRAGRHQNYYLDDGAKLQAILNNPDALAPAADAAGRSDPRCAQRDDRGAPDRAGRQQKFFAIEAKYRVALVILAADGGLARPCRRRAAPKPAATPLRHNIRCLIASAPLILLLMAACPRAE